MGLKYTHPYDMKTARWIRQHLIMESDDDKRKEFLKELESIFTTRYAEILRYISNDYRIYLRDDQLIKGFDDNSWVGTVFCCGRAFGKTWCGAPATIEFAMQNPGCRIGLLAPTFGMGKTNMVEGASGIIQLSPIGFKPKFNRSEGLLEWPNGSTAKIFSAENGSRVRGENLHFIWADEFCFFKFTGDDNDLWKMAKMALRAGRDPKYVITTSPRPVKIIKDLYEQSKKPNSKVVFNTGTTYDNYALPQSYIDEIDALKGTSLYDQEILGKILDENLNAIFTNESIKRIDLNDRGDDPDQFNSRMQKLIDSMDSIVISVDPNVVEDENSDETGIVVCGRKDGRGYVFKDASRRGRINDIYKTVVSLYWQYKAECVVVETNNGGDFIPTAIFNIDPYVVVKTVYASRGKRSRAEPIGLLYERGMIYHVGLFRELEAQMTEYNPQVHTKSPDRMDSLVWGFWHLFPASMRGLFDHGTGPSPYHRPTTKDEVKDLYEEFYKEAEAGDMYSLHSGPDDDDTLYGDAVYDDDEGEFDYDLDI